MPLSSSSVDRPRASRVFFTNHGPPMERTACFAVAQPKIHHKRWTTNGGHRKLCGCNPKSILFVPL